MKIRNGFVSNSSSSSFIVLKSHLSEHQLKELQCYDGGDYWDILVTDSEVRGFTIMDNGDMGEYMDRLGIDRNKVEWEYHR